MGQTCEPSVRADLTLACSYGADVDKRPFRHWYGTRAQAPWGEFSVQGLDAVILDCNFWGKMACSMTFVDLRSKISREDTCIMNIHVKIRRR